MRSTFHWHSPISRQVRDDGDWKQYNPHYLDSDAWAIHRIVRRVQRPGSVDVIVGADLSATTSGKLTLRKFRDIAFHDPGLSRCQYPGSTSRSGSAEASVKRLSSTASMGSGSGQGSSRSTACPTRMTADDTAAGSATFHRRFAHQIPQTRRVFRQPRANQHGQLYTAGKMKIPPYATFDSKQQSLRISRVRAKDRNPENAPLTPRVSDFR